MGYLPFLLLVCFGLVALFRFFGCAECFLKAGDFFVDGLMLIFGGEAARASSGPRSVSVDGKGIVTVAIKGQLQVG